MPMMRWMVACLALATPAFANDSSSEVAAGGLVLTKTDAIAMQREDLALSPSEVRVRYEFRNDTGKPVTLRVAFPLPEVPKDTPGGTDSMSGGHIIDNLQLATPNFLGFRVWVAGQEIAPELEIHAQLPDGRDVADELLRAGGIALVLRPRLFERASPGGKLAGSYDGGDLDAATRKRLQELGALEQDTTFYDLLWTTRITFHWQQTFAPGVTVVEHAYRPILGSQWIAAVKQGHDGEADAAHDSWNGSANENLARDFCIDGPTDRAMRAQYARQLQKRVAAGDAHDAYFTAYMLGYILQTARNWHGPIGTFHLTLQGGHFATGFAGAGEVTLMSLCTDLPLRATGKLRFEATVTDYVPKQDLRVLLLRE